MYKKTFILPTTDLNVNDSYEGEYIEDKIRRVMNNGEPITDSVSVIYTERKDGVQADYNIRTDRWEHAVEAMDLVSKQHVAKRDERITLAEEAKKNMETEKKDDTKKDG